MCVFMSKPLIDRDFTCPKYVQNNWKKQLTSPCYFEILSSHTVTTEQKQKHMRTKTLLIAAAALAVSAGISMAQTYSQNIVGYANVVIAGNGQYSLLANPFDDGNGNLLTNLLNTALPKQSQCSIWDPIAGFNTISKGGTPAAWPAGNHVFGTHILSRNSWKDRSYPGSVRLPAAAGRSVRSKWSLSQSTPARSRSQPDRTMIPHS